MSLSMSVWVVVMLAIVGANLPFFNNRLFAVIPLSRPKTLVWRLGELFVCYFVVGGIGLALEQSVGQIYTQRWEFYAITATLFLTLAFPGFVFKYLRKS